MQEASQHQRVPQTHNPILSRSFTICMALTVVAAYGLVIGARRIIVSDRVERRNHDAIGRLEEARANVRSAVSNMRAYLLSGDASHQQACASGIDEARENLIQFSEISGRSQEVSGLQANVSSAYSAISQVMAERSESGPSSSARLASNARMTELIASVESGIASELSGQSKIIEVHREKRQDDFLLTEIAFIVTLLFGTAAMALAVLSLKREALHRRAAEVQHANARQDLLTIQSMLELSDQRDKLTTLLNREAFDRILEQEYEKNRKTKHAVSLVVAHVDQLPQVRDSKGVHAGDDVLRKAAGILKDSFRGGDVICRYGEGEFAVILPRTNLQNATIAAERARALIEQAEWSECNITASFGVAQADYLKERDELISRTEQAVDYARRTGRNRVTAIRAYLPMSA